jgi:hypothetical protein
MSVNQVPKSPGSRGSRARVAAAPAAIQREQAEVFRQALLLAVLMAVAAVALPLQAQTPKPERERPLGTPQALGVVHTVRNIPEACTRLEGVFTGDAAQPYRMQALQTAPGCQSRARYLDAAQAKPSQAAGWILNDVVRVPDAGCPSRQAVVQVWRKPVDQPVELDAQGRVRIYLQDAQRQAAAEKMRPLPQFSAVLEMPAGRCG